MTPGDQWPFPQRVSAVTLMQHIYWAHALVGSSMREALVIWNGHEGSSDGSSRGDALAHI